MGTQVNRGMLKSAGAGPDGSTFVGVDDDGAPIILHRLDGPAMLDPLRRRRLDHRMSLHAQATHERQPLLLALRRASLVDTPPLVILEHPRRSLTDLPLWTDVETARAGLHVLRDCALALALLHSGGVAHGRLRTLGRSAVRVRDDNTVGISALGLCTGVAGDLAHHALLTSSDVDDDSIAADVYAFGGLCLLAAFGPDAPRALAVEALEVPSSATSPQLRSVLRELSSLVVQLRHDEPSWRLPLLEAAQQLEGFAGELARDVSFSSTPPPAGVDIPVERGHADNGDDVDGEPAVPAQLGRFRLAELVGAGAMGRVYRGVDVESGDPVAIKLLARDGPTTKKAMRRFQKEARLLGEIQSPGVARFLDAGRDGEVLYLVTEFVEGEPLGRRLRSHGALPEREAVDIVVEVLRALADVHDHGIVHRDLKPDNMMLLSRTGQTPRVKIIDFGVARHLEEEGSLALTRRGAVMGTPLYMAPEQVRGERVDQRTDLYAVGSILFELLAGRPPFAGLGASAVLACQLEQTPPLLSDLVTGVSPALTHLIARALQKDVEARFTDARAMLSALVPLSSDGRRAPAPPAPPSPSTQRWSSTWRLRSTAEQLWPFVSDTERMSQALGLVAVDGGFDEAGGGALLRGRASQLGLPVRWNEHPYEWEHLRRLSVHREYTNGPLLSLKSIVELSPGDDGRGTRLVHTLEVEPRGLIGRALAAIEVGGRIRRELDRLYTRIDALVGGQTIALDVDPFARSAPLSAAQEARLATAEAAMVGDGVAAAVVERLGTWLRAAPAQDVARVRPRALARRLDLADDVVVDACLWAAHRGALVVLWDLLCPTCRVPSGIAPTLKALREHGRCEACDLSYSLDLSASVELIFRAHPAVRDVDTGTYCLSSPAHTPHVFAQRRVPAGVVLPLHLTLPAGRYRLTARRAAWTHDFVVRENAAPASWRVSLTSGPVPDSGHLLAPGVQHMVLDNDTDREQLVRIERTAPRDDVLTATQVLARPLFRRLFPGELPGPDAMLRSGDVNFLLAEMRAPAATLAARYAALREIDDAVVRGGGTVVRLQGVAGVLATFPAALDAVKAARLLPAAVGASDVSAAQPDTLAVAVHRGEAGALVLGDRLDYFGEAVDDIVALVDTARRGELVVSDAVRDDASRADVAFDAVGDDASDEDDTVADGDAHPAKTRAAAHRAPLSARP